MERVTILFVKQRSSVSEPPFRGLTGNVCDSSVARWKLAVELLGLLVISEYFSLAFIQLRQYEQTCVEIGLC